MIVAVVAVRVVQVAVDQVVDVIAVWNRFVAAARPMHVARFVRAAGMTGRASVRIAVAQADRVLLNGPIGVLMV
jgi:hypothetical protein